MDEDEPLSRADFLRRVASKRAVALSMVDDAEHCFEAWLASGYAVEFALKALIMSYERLNAWPSRVSRPELYTHDLQGLFIRSGLAFAQVTGSLRGSLRTVLDWDRGHEYKTIAMPPKVARGMVDAAFGEDGVVPWLTKR